MSDEPNIRVAGGGPYVVSGDVPLTTKSPVMSEHGEPLTWTTERSAETADRYLLCRCGASANKPFCDGTHASTDWDDDDHVPEGTYAWSVRRASAASASRSSRPAHLCARGVLWQQGHQRVETRCGDRRQPHTCGGDGHDRTLSVGCAHLCRGRRGDRARSPGGSCGHPGWPTLGQWPRRGHASRWPTPWNRATACHTVSMWSVGLEAVVRRIPASRRASPAEPRRPSRTPRSLPPSDRTEPTWPLTSVLR